MSIKLSYLPLVSIVLLIAPKTPAETPNWPTWRGPLATGIVTEGNPPIEWSETKNIRWKIELTGDGSNSTPIIWGDKLIYQNAVSGNNQAAPKDTYQFNLVCRDRHTGKRLWSKTVAEAIPSQRHHADHGFVSFSPVTDGQLIWANFGSLGLFCYDLDGNQKWHVDLGTYNIRRQFGAAGSPALAQDKIVIVKDHEDQSFIAAYNKTTGDPIWKKDRQEGTNWATPLTVDVAGHPQLVVNGNYRVYGYDAANGDILWECTGQTINIIPTPVFDKGLVFCTSGFRGAKLQAIRLGRTGNLTGTDGIAWELDKACPYVPSPLCYQDKVYVCDVSKAVISCYEAASGKPFYTDQKLPDLQSIYASPIGVANRVYFVGRNGVTSVLENSDTLKILATNTLDDNIDCSPVVIGNTLYLKGKKYLYCIED